MFDINEFIQRAMLFGPVILFSLTVHEFAHAWTANRFGDPTAKNMGRLTLNPLAHLDLFGTLVMVMTGFRFGWAKPVPVNPANLRNPRVADIWISAAGPLSNLALAILSGLLFRMFGAEAGEAARTMMYGGVLINLALMFFNLIPLFPLDGSHILRNLLPYESQAALSRFERFAPLLLLVLVFTGVFWMVVGPIIQVASAILMGVH